MSFLMMGVACWIDKWFGRNFALKVQWSWVSFLVMLSSFFPNWEECFRWEWDQFTPCEIRLTQDSIASRIVKFQLDFIMEWLLRKWLKLNKCNLRTCVVTYCLNNIVFFIHYVDLSFFCSIPILLQRNEI